MGGDGRRGSLVQNIYAGWKARMDDDEGGLAEGGGYPGAAAADPVDTYGLFGGDAVSSVCVLEGGREVLAVGCDGAVARRTIC